MNAMYYKINLPKNYDMNIIRERVENNGSKTDGFPDLFFKAYLIRSDKEHNEYSPFYIWKNSEGMNKFIFEGFFDNILDSFGWQNINIGIPLTVELDETFRHSKYCIEIEHEINQTYFLSRPEFSLPKEGYSGKVLVYNPDKWRYMNYIFTKINQKIYLRIYMKSFIFLNEKSIKPQFYRKSCKIKCSTNRCFIMIVCKKYFYKVIAF